MRTDGKNIPFSSTAENKWDLFKKKIVEKRRKSECDSVCGKKEEEEEEGERERERERERVCGKKEEEERERECVCVCVCEREENFPVEKLVIKSLI